MPFFLYDWLLDLSRRCILGGPRRIAVVCTSILGSTCWRYSFVVASVSPVFLGNAR